MNLSLSVFKKLEFFLTILKKHQRLVVSVLGFEVLLALLNATIPYFTKFQIDQLEQRARSFYFVTEISPFLLFGLLLAVPTLIELARLMFFEKVSRKFQYKFDIELQLETEKTIWDKLKTLDAGFFQNRRNQRILTSAISSTRVTNDFFQFLKRRVSSLVTVIAIIPLLGLVSWQLLVLVSVVTILQLLLSEISRKQEMALSTLQDRQREKYWKVEQALTYHFHTLLTLGATEEFLAKYQELAREREEIDLKRDNANQVLETFEWLLRNGLTVVASLFVGYQVIEGSVSLGTFTLVMSYTLQLNGVFRGLLESAKNWRDIDLQLDRLRFFQMLKPRIKIDAHPTALSIRPSKISLENVKFAYPNLFAEEKEYLRFMMAKTEGFLSQFKSYHYQREFDQWQEILNEDKPKEPVLLGVDLKLEQGKLVALLGRNGAGKTTITHLLMHHYEATEGSVMLDGQPLSSFTTQSLNQQFAIIQQKPFILYQFSLRENLLLGVNRLVSEAEIWELLSELDLKNVLEKLPQKLETILGEGINLSGGQEQLVAVARVLLQKRPFIIFDEGMNQLDIEHETKVLSLLKKQTEVSAVLFITHRITTARKADYIYMLDEGKVAEQGTHDQLLKKKGLYAQFWGLQVIE